MSASSEDTKRRLDEAGGHIPAFLQESYQQAERRARELSNRAYQRYAGERLAPSNPALRRSFELAQQTGLGNPYLQSSHEHVLRGTQRFPQGYQEYMDPYQKAVVNEIREQGGKFLKENIMPELENRFIKLGQHGSSRHAKLSRRAAAEIQRQIASQQEEALSKGYQHALTAFNADRAREMQGAGTLSTLGLARHALNAHDIQALREAGLGEQEIEQRQRDLAYENWKEEQRHPLEALSHYFSVLQGVPYVPSTYSKSEIFRPRPSTTMHGSDWRDMGLGVGGDLLLRLLRARGGRVRQSMAPHLRGCS